MTITTEDTPPPCPHCGSTKDPYFDRSYTLDSKGNEIDGPCYRCVKCGKKVE